MSEVAATRVNGWDDLNKPGDFYIVEEHDYHRLMFYCPCGNCSRMFVCGIPIKTGLKEEKFWQWDGNIFKPTITPSIFRHVNCMAHGDTPAHTCEWHGFLTNGIFRSV